MKWRHVKNPYNEMVLEVIETVVIDGTSHEIWRRATKEQAEAIFSVASTPRKVRLSAKRSWASCECCGTYDMVDFEMSLDGKIVFEDSADNHLSGGNMRHDLQDVATLINALGFEVEIVDE